MSPQEIIRELTKLSRDELTQVDLRLHELGRVSARKKTVNPAKGMLQAFRISTQRSLPSFCGLKVDSQSMVPMILPPMLRATLSFRLRPSSPRAKVAPVQRPSQHKQPRNVLIQRPDGTKVVRTFRGLRRARKERMNKPPSDRVDKNAES